MAQEKEKIIQVKEKVKAPAAIILALICILLSIVAIAATSPLYQAPAAIVQSAFAGTVYYVDCQSGNDANSGLTAATAWKTLAKINKSAFAAGDQILLKRGCVWREQLLPPSSGASGKPIVIDAYGAGAKPLILASEKNLAWTRVAGTNKWKTPAISIYSLYQNTNVGFIRLTRETADPVWGANVAKVVDAEASLTADGQFYWNCTVSGKSDCSAGEIIMYSSNAGGPNAQWPDMEVGLRARGLQIIGKSYLTVKNLDLRYGTAGSLRIASSSHDIVLEGIEASYGGGTKTSATWTASGAQIRAGDLVKMDTGSYNITVLNSKVSNSWESCISVEAWAGRETLHDIYIVNNSVDRCNLGIGVNVPAYSGVSDNRIYNIFVKNNNISNTGYGWSPAGNASHGRGIWLYQNDDSTKNSSQYNIYIEGNTIDKFSDAGIYIMNGGPYYIYKNVIKNGTAAYVDSADAKRISNSAILVHGGGYVETYGDVNGQIIGNLIYDNASRGLAILNNKPASALEIYNNTFSNNGSGIFGSIDSTLSDNFKFENNIVYADKAVLYLMGSDSTAITSDYNCFYRPAGTLLKRSGNSYAKVSAYAAAYPLEANSLDVNPKFVSVSADLNLQAASPAIDKGRSTGSTVIAARGAAIDLGALEYQPACAPNWSCAAWSSCAGGSQTRVCSDANNCGQTAGKPAETQSCAAACSAKTCAELGYVCGTWSDGCNSTVACGACAANQTCASGVCQDALTVKTGDGVCGNGVKDGNEACDSTDFGGKTCLSAGFKKGAPVCSGDCQKIDYSACTYCTSNDACKLKYPAPSKNSYCSKTTYPGKCCRKSLWLYNCAW